MIGWLAPPVCISCEQEGNALCEICAETEILPYGAKCWHCGSISNGNAACNKAQRLGSPSSVWVVTDYESTAKKLIESFKFGHQRHSALPMAELMLHTLLEYNSDKTFMLKNYLIIPVPTATSRVRQRSFDHTALLARNLSFKSKIPSSSTLHRSGQSRQVGATRSKRFAQLEAGFYVSNAAKIRNRNILLVDDVITTGATICAAAKTLKSAGAKTVDALVFAKKL